ncbi:MAG TPA: glycosyltransferase family 2 protein [Acidobacteriaceae bacterium]
MPLTLLAPGPAASPLLRSLPAALEWLLALGWITRAANAAWHLSEIPNLLDPRYLPSAQQPDPCLSVVVPALNEEAAIGPCLRSLLASRGVTLQIVAVNDRSTDATGAVMETIAREAASTPHTLRVLHINALPAGWLGKPHALATGAAHTSGDFLLFTDGDSFYAPDALARCMLLVHEQAADHLVLLPTPILKSPGERMMLGMIQVTAIWGVRLWKVADPRAWDSIGVGCFNLLRRSAYDAIGGFASLRMEILEDLRLGYLVKRRGLRQRVAFGPDLLRLHWAPGALGIVRTMTKNLYALCRYNPVMLLAAVCGNAILALAPFAGLFGPPAVRLPSLLTVLTIAALYAANARRTRVPAGYAALFPAASALMLYAMVRSALITLTQGGVRWRGTFYPLRELRRNAGRLWWWELLKRKD